MSIATWKKEFYGPMGKAVKSKKAALAHSLKKWQGLTPANLKKHGLRPGGDVIEDADDSFFIGTNSCALCLKWFDVSCDGCPLVMVLGEPCDATDDAPFCVWLDDCNPTPMIKALRKAMKLADPGVAR